MLFRSTAKLKGKLGTITIKTKDGKFCDPTVNGNHQFLQEMWLMRNALIGKKCTVKYFGITPDGSLRFPKVIQIDRLD